jgi:hypothetical protein
MRRHRFIAAQATRPPVARSGRGLGVARSGHSAWHGRDEPARARADAAPTARLTAIRETSRQTDGSPRVPADLRASGERKSWASQAAKAAVQAAASRPIIAPTVPIADLPSLAAGGHHRPGLFACQPPGHVRPTGLHAPGLAAIMAPALKGRRGRSSREVEPCVGYPAA